MDVLPALAVRGNARLRELVPEKTTRESRLRCTRSRIFKMLSKRPRGNERFKKFPQSLLGKEAGFFDKGEFSMRLGPAILLGATAALLTLAAPTLARNSETHSNTQKASEPPAASCHAYQQAADGSWTQLPCQEMGSKAQPQPRSAAKGATEETR